METTVTLSAKSTNAASLEIYSPERIALEYREVNSPKEVFAVAKANHLATLGGIMRTAGSTRVEALLKLYLIQLNEVLGLKQAMTELQIDTAARDIIDRYPYMNMVDINLVFKRIRCGDCGKIFDRLTLPQLMGFFSDYNDWRCDEAAQISMEEAESYKSVGIGERSSERSASAWKSALKANFMRNLKRA